jgi:hypothetical protein
MNLVEIKLTSDQKDWLLTGNITYNEDAVRYDLNVSVFERNGKYFLATHKAGPINELRVLGAAYSLALEYDAVPSDPLDYAEKHDTKYRQEEFIAACKKYTGYSPSNLSWLINSTIEEL